MVSLYLLGFRTGCPWSEELWAKPLSLSSGLKITHLLPFIYVSRPGGVTGQAGLASMKSGRPENACGRGSTPASCETGPPRVTPSRRCAWGGDHRAVVPRPEGTGSTWTSSEVLITSVLCKTSRDVETKLPEIPTLIQSICPRLTSTIPTYIFSSALNMNHMYGDEQT